MTDDLDVLYVAHDALIEGRPTCDVLAQASPWARYDRLLGQSMMQQYLDLLIARARESLGASVDVSVESELGSMLRVYAEQLVEARMWTDRVAVVLGIS